MMQAFSSKCNSAIADLVGWVERIHIFEQTYRFD
jgi:hypothetical protein